MNARVTPALLSFSARFFVVFLALTVWAFWPSYFARLLEQPSVWFHAHGIVLALWLVMLVVQAQLIRTQRCAWHRQLGKLSYVVAPAVVVLTTVFVHQRVSASVAGLPKLAADGAAFLGADAAIARRVRGVLWIGNRAAPRLADARALDATARDGGLPQMQEQFAASAPCSRWSPP